MFQDLVTANSKLKELINLCKKKIIEHFELNISIVSCVINNNVCKFTQLSREYTRSVSHIQECTDFKFVASIKKGWEFSLPNDRLHH